MAHPSQQGEHSGRDRARRPVAVLTGASSPVGRATAKLLAVRGYDVGLLDSDEAALRAAADDVLANGGLAVAVDADVSEWKQVRHAAHEVEARIGPVDVWINQAMARAVGPVATLDPIEIRHVTETAYLGQVHGVLAALDVMRPRDRGTIVSVSSAFAYRSIADQSAQCGSAAGTRAFVDSVRSELRLADRHIRVTQVVLPAVDAEPEVAAQVIVDAARRAPRRRVLGMRNRLMLGLDSAADRLREIARLR